MNVERRDWWTAADAAELDLLLYEFVRVNALHKPRCEECSQGGPWCDRLADSFDAVLEWKHARELRSKAAWLRLRELERERESGRVHVVFDECGEIGEFKLRPVRRGKGRAA